MKMETNRICIVVCYFGSLPWYFDFFVHSCAYNQQIDFLIITDNSQYSKPIPANLKFVETKLYYINELIVNKLGLDADIENPYKLCDFKPAYGLLFEENLQGYDFWGHGDIDVIYGDIKEFVTDNILDEYDVISVRAEYVSGFFALYRNELRINSLFKQSVDYEEVFRTREYCALDECGGVCLDLIAGIDLNDLITQCESMTHVLKKEPFASEIRSYFELHAAESLPGKLLWDNGTLTYDDQFEIILYHLIDFKRQAELEIPCWKTIPDRFFINRSSITSTKIGTV